MRRSLFLLIMLAAAQPVQAQDAAEKLGECLIALTTGADRIALVKWIGFSIVAHPAMADNIAVTKSSIGESNQVIGDLVTELMTVRCKSEAVAAFALGDQAIENAFGALGKVAMQEVMRDNAVQTRMMEFVNYVDEAAFDDLMK